jgi:methylmalonyl-CoA/ethylmalonyl-CoA epimerase
LQLRVALTTQDYERLLSFYRDGLGIEAAEHWTDGEGEGVLMEMGAGSLEIFNETYTAKVDQIEVGTSASGAVRFAIQVPDLQAALKRLEAWEGALVHPPVLTPWGDLNARVQDPDGMQITLFQAPPDKPYGG